MFFPISEMPPRGMIFSLEANVILLFLWFGRKNRRLLAAQAKKPKSDLAFSGLRGAKAAKPAVQLRPPFPPRPSTPAAKRRAFQGAFRSEERRITALVSFEV